MDRFLQILQMPNAFKEVVSGYTLQELYKLFLTVIFHKF